MEYVPSLSQDSERLLALAMLTSVTQQRLLTRESVHFSAVFNSSFVATTHPQMISILYSHRRATSFTRRAGSSSPALIRSNDEMHGENRMRSQSHQRALSSAQYPRAMYTLLQIVTAANATKIRSRDSVTSVRWKWCRM